jgi:hypothetical protein
MEFLVLSSSEQSHLKSLIFACDADDEEEETKDLAERLRYGADTLAFRN